MYRARGRPGLWCAAWAPRAASAWCSKSPPGVRSRRSDARRTEEAPGGAACFLLLASCGRRHASCQRLERARQRRRGRGLRGGWACTGGDEGIAGGAGALVGGGNESAAGAFKLVGDGGGNARNEGRGRLLESAGRPGTDEQSGAGKVSKCVGRVLEPRVVWRATPRQTRALVH